MTNDVRQTPMLKQYFGVKREYPDALLFFRMGDFFELFFEDAKVAAKVLGIALTSRSKETDMPMAGVPVRSVDSYLHKLIQAGHTVVICDQVEDAKQAKGLVQREVTRIVTAGTLLEDALLTSGQHNFLAAAAPGPGDCVGLAWLDLSTGRFEGRSVSTEHVADELARRPPAELLVPERWRDELPAALESWLRTREGLVLRHRPDHDFETPVARDALHRQLGVGTLRGFGIDDSDPLIAPAGAVLGYAREMQRGELEHVRSLRRCEDQGRMRLDPCAIQALELLETTRDRRREGTLLWCIDRTRTAAGGRLLRDWVLEPLTEVAAIERRLDAVEELLETPSRRQGLRDELEGIFDLERITARLAAQRCSPRDLAQLRDSLRRLPALRSALAACSAGSLLELGRAMQSPPELLEQLERSLEEAPPHSARDGGLIRTGFHAELDELRTLRSGAKDTLAALQRREIERTGIASLKIGFNSVFGYYLEVTHAHRERVPEDYHRKQTLKNAERYITPELKELETKLLSAEERALALELELFEELRARAAEQVSEVQELARSLARLDALASLAEAAAEHGYRRPHLEDSTRLEIAGGCHPVLRSTLGRDAFVPNDVHLGAENATLALITGPNMAGKSTYLRQTALLVLLAQIGSFVPADEARIGTVDRIFTRVGASDDLVQGQSTFMVEMTETANLLHHATRRSLVVLDEIGRGTGTFDGLSLARALAEHLASEVGCRTLFATHYHQLTRLAEQIPAVTNLSVAVKEWGEQILFLHKIVDGGTDRSYGLHVAQLAGIPAVVVERARRLLEELEAPSRAAVATAAAGGQSVSTTAKSTEPRRNEPTSAERSALLALRRIDVERTTPLQALQLLADLQRRADEDARASTSKRRRSSDQAETLFDG